MALLFSAVKMAANNQETEFFVGGIPMTLDDFNHWIAFDNFMKDLDKETEIVVHVEVYSYGTGESYNATPEEVAYFMMRIEKDDTFLSRCNNITSMNFTFKANTWQTYLQRKS